MFIAVVAWTAENRISKYQDFATQAEAQAHVAKVRDQFPLAFVAAAPGDAFADWLIDPAAKTLSLDPLPFVKPIPNEDDVIKQALIDTNVLTQADLDAARAKL